MDKKARKLTETEEQIIRMSLFAADNDVIKASETNAFMTPAEKTRIAVTAAIKACLFNNVLQAHPNAAEVIENFGFQIQFDEE